MSGTIPPKPPSLRATVSSSTSAICHAFLFTLLHMQRGSFSASCSAQNVVSDFVRFWLELAIPLLALMAGKGIVQTSPLSSASAPDQVHGPPSAVVQLFTLAAVGSHKSLLFLWELKTVLGPKSILITGRRNIRQIPHFFSLQNFLF